MRLFKTKGTSSKPFSHSCRYIVKKHRVHTFLSLPCIWASLRVFDMYKQLSKHTYKKVKVCDMPVGLVGKSVVISAGRCWHPVCVYRSHTRAGYCLTASSTPSALRPSQNWSISALVLSSTWFRLTARNHLNGGKWFSKTTFSDWWTAFHNSCSKGMHHHHWWHQSKQCVYTLC